MPPKQPTEEAREDRQREDKTREDRTREDRTREDRDLDEALEETFPASDPIAPMRRGEDD